MRLSFFAAPAALVLVLSSSALAETYEDRLALAQEITDISMEVIDLDAMIDTMWQPIATESAARGKPLSTDQQAELEQLYRDTFRVPMREIMASQSPVMAELMSEAELIALRDFYSTPEGRSVMGKLPKVMEQQQPQIIAFVQQNMPKVMPKVMEILGAQ